jgi:hypothetical protein
MALKMNIPSPDVRLSMKTGIPKEACSIFLAGEPFEELARVTEEFLLTKKQAKELKEIGATVADLLDEMYSVPEIEVVAPIFHDWDTRLGLDLFKPYSYKSKA